jgi:hypothetical protein
MAENQTELLYSEFASLYKAADLGDNPEQEKLRFAGLTSAVKKLDREDIEALVRLTFHTKALPSNDVITGFRQAFKDADKNGYDMAGNLRELEVLAGIALVAAFRRRDMIAAYAAISVSNAACIGSRTVNLPVNLIGLSEAAILEVAQSTRKRSDLAISSRSDVALDISKALEALTKQQDFPTIINTINSVTEVTRVAMVKLEEKHGRAVSILSGYLTIQDEELQLLWWLVGERSWDMDKPFDQLGGSRTLVLAKELAQMTQRIPGPRSIKALLSRAGLRDDKPQTIPTAINACDAGWLGGLVSPDDSPVTQPLHFGIMRKLETGDDKDWVAGWAGAAGLDAAREFHPIDLALLFYRERLLSMR